MAAQGGALSTLSLTVTWLCPFQSPLPPACTICHEAALGSELPYLTVYQVKAVRAGNQCFWAWIALLSRASMHWMPTFPLNPANGVVPEHPLSIENCFLRLLVHSVWTTWCESLGPLSLLAIDLPTFFWKLRGGCAGGDNLISIIPSCSEVHSPYSCSSGEIIHRPASCSPDCLGTCPWNHSNT